MLWKFSGVLLISFLLLALARPVLAYTPPTINLASLPNNSELTLLMTGAINKAHLHSLEQALAYKNWQPITANQLSLPRQSSQVWLNAILYNDSPHSIVSWVAIEPWRVSKVSAYMVDPITQHVISENHTGKEVPLASRKVQNGKTVIPIHLNAGERQQLLLSVSSSSLPFLQIRYWQPDTYTQHISDSRLGHIALLASIITLLAILLFQLNTSLIITSLWLLVAFIFESEKDGFFSYYLLNSLADYALNLRISAWGFTEQLFLTTSVFLLGLHRSRAWQAWLVCTAFAAALLAALTFVLDSNQARQLGIIITGSFALSWPLMITSALRIQRPQQITLLLLLALYWLASSFLLLGYIFNFYYSSTFAAARIYIEIAVALALILTYNWQQKHQLSQAEQALKNHEAHSRAQLEKTVAARTKALHSALDTAKNVSQAKVEFLAQVSHDLLAPLTAILGYAQLQEIGTVDTHKANRIIQNRATYMQQLINRLTDEAPPSHLSNDLKDLYVIAFIDNIVNQAHILAAKQHNRFQLKINSALPTLIHCPQLTWQRILLNLLDNAAKYTQQGYISLSVMAHSEPVPKLEFVVADTGRGMTEQQLARAYQPFFQSSANNPGQGLGLAICAQLVQELGGKLTISSQPNQGTTINCMLPYQPGSEHAVNTTLPVVRDLLPVFDVKGKTAWIIEDTVAVRDLLEEELTEQGFITQSFESAEQFCTDLASTTTDPDIIITDYQLPNASGSAVLQAAQRCLPHVPVILLSAEQPRAEFEMFSAFLAKPIDLLTLRLTLANLCNLSERE